MVMRQVKKWRYYCDFCKKSGSSKSHMAKHEASCTMNPNRDCKLHRLAFEESQPDLTIMIDYIQAFWNKHYHKDDVSGMECCDTNWDEYQEAETQLVNDLMDIANGCPNCTLAAIRQSGHHLLEFNYRDELKKVMDRHNEEMKQQDYDDQMNYIY
jgi:hypothetical protein